MAPWQRLHRDETELDRRIEASREAFVAEHDATFDFEAGWAEIVARAEAATRPAARTAPATRRSRRDTADDVGPAVVDPRRRPGRRRMLAGVGSIAASAAVVAAIAIFGGGGDGEADLEPRIVAATRSALADSIEHEVTDWADTPEQVDDEAWRDQTTAAVRFLHHARDGSGPSSDTGPVTAPTPDEGAPPTGPVPYLTVDHCFGEYAVADVPFPEQAANASASQAKAVAERLDDGTMRTDGTEVVDGEELIRVVEVGGPDSVVWYVDPETYRPVRMVDTAEGYVTTIEYLPRTPDGLAQFTPVVPDGLAEVDELSRTGDTRPCS